MTPDATFGWSGTEVKASFNAVPSILYYTRAAHFLGLWRSERLVIRKFLPDEGTRLVEAGCGAGRVTLGLWKMGYRRIVAFDFAGELVDQAQSLATESGARSIAFRCSDATSVTGPDLGLAAGEGFGGALFMFNGLMQIPGRENRRSALHHLRSVCKTGSPLIFTSHDRDAGSGDQSWWRDEAEKWGAGRQDPRLIDFGDRQFHDESGEVFIHIPDRAEIMGDLRATGWIPHFDAMRSELSDETRAVTDFSDDCRFWVALRGG
jgi:ubiquinone/menaquinone biosynthesis C-methylase UbiE